MNYGAALLEASKLIGTYSRKILRHVDPAGLLVEQHTKVEFAINLKTAKTLDVKFLLPLLGPLTG
jgi:hypothetical protein